MFRHSGTGWVHQERLKPVLLKGLARAKISERLLRRNQKWIVLFRYQTVSSRVGIIIDRGNFHWRHWRVSGNQGFLVVYYYYYSNFRQIYIYKIIAPPGNFGFLPISLSLSLSLWFAGIAMEEYQWNWNSNVTFRIHTMSQRVLIIFQYIELESESELDQTSISIERS